MDLSLVNSAYFPNSVNWTSMATDSLDPFLNSSHPVLGPSQNSICRSTEYVKCVFFDLRCIQLSGTLPASLAKLETLQEIEFGNNRLVGEIPEEYGNMPVLRQLELDGNQLTGKIPAAFKGLNETITSLLLSENDLEGDLSALAGTHLMGVAIHGNAKLCGEILLYSVLSLYNRIEYFILGMVPASVRYAHGYDPSGTNLGKPC